MRLFVCFLEEEGRAWPTCDALDCDYNCGHEPVLTREWVPYTSYSTSGISCFDRPGPAVSAARRYERANPGLRAVVKYVDVENLLTWTDDADVRAQESEAAMLRLGEQAQRIERGEESALPAKRPPARKKGRIP